MFFISHNLLICPYFFFKLIGWTGFPVWLSVADDDYSSSIIIRLLDGHSLDKILILTFYGDFLMKERFLIMWKKSISTVLMFLFTVSPMQPLFAMNSDSVIELEDLPQKNTDNPYKLLVDENEKYFQVHAGTSDAYEFIRYEAFLEQGNSFFYGPALALAIAFEMMHRGMQVSLEVLRYTLMFLGIGLTPEQFYLISKILLIVSTFFVNSTLTLREHVEKMEFNLGLRNGTISSLVESTQNSAIDVSVGGSLGIHQDLPPVPDWQKIPNASIPFPTVNVTVPVPPIPNVSVPIPSELPPTLIPLPIANPVSIPAVLPPTPDNALLQQEIDKVINQVNEKLITVVDAANDQGYGYVSSLRSLLPPGIDIKEALKIDIHSTMNFMRSLGFGSNINETLIGSLAIGGLVNSIMPDSAVTDSIGYIALIGCLLMIEEASFAYTTFKNRPRLLEQKVRTRFKSYFASQNEASTLSETWKKTLELAQHPLFRLLSIGGRFSGAHLLYSGFLNKGMNRVFQNLAFDFDYNSPKTNTTNTSLVDSQFYEQYNFSYVQVGANLSSSQYSDAILYNSLQMVLFAALQGVQSVGYADMQLLVGSLLFSFGVATFLLQVYADRQPKVMKGVAHY